MQLVHPNAPCTLRKLTIAIALALPTVGSPLSVLAADRATQNTVNPQSTLINFKIAAQPLAEALNAFIAASDWQVGFPAGLAKDIKSSAVNGNYTPQQALQQLLIGSGLTYRTTGTNNVILEKAPEQLNKAGPTTLKPMTVVGKASRDVTDPYNQDYVLPNATAGTKTDTPIMETPLNVQVVSKQVLKDQQVINLSDALKNVSGVTVLGNASNASSDGGALQSFVLRGFESQFFFRNGFRLQQGSASRSMANVESVEVLKGPAAILYGMVEPGGMVNVITKQPLANPYYSVNQQFGSYDLYRTTVDTGGPVANNKDLLYRMNLSYENSGSIRQFVGKEDVFFAPVVKWIISPKTDVTLEFEYDHNHFGYDTGTQPYFNGKAINVPRRINYGEYSPATTETAYGGFTLAHQFNDDWSVKQRFSVNQQSNDHPHFYTAYFADEDNLQRFDIGDKTQYKTYSSNLDLTGHFNTLGLKHTLLLGGDFYHLHTKASSMISVDSSFNFFFSPINIFNPVHPGTPVPLFNFQAKLTDTDQYGAYIQDQIELPYNFHVLGGIRYQNLHQSILSSSFEVPNSPTSQSQDAVTPRVGILWRARPWLSLYANYVESFGANDGIMYPNKIVPGTSAEQYEGGIKTEFFDGKLRANLAYYDLTKTNITSGDPAHPTFVGVTGAARSHGPELDITGEPLPGWNVITTYAYTDVRVTKTNTDNEATFGGAVPVGGRFFNVPRNTASFWNTYEFLESDLKGLKFGGGVTLRDGQPGCCDVPAVTIPGYATVDLLAAYSLKVGPTKITTQLNINNLLDKRYYTGLLSQGFNTVGYSSAGLDFGQPRTVMGSINVQF